MQRTKKQLGPYRVLKQIGQGGMGVVFVGEHTASGKQVAIKMATKHEATKLNQLRQEIRSLAKIQHPGVVQILDHGVSDGLPWHAMEVIEAPTLTNVTKQIWSSQRTKRYVNNASNVFLPGQDSDTTITQVGEINLRESVEFKDYKFLTNRSSDAAAGRLKDVLTLTYGICEVLSYVHSSGIIHRDLKPDNIFILENMYPVLVDFGLVSEVRGTVGREVLEDAQATSGSPFFMAPEQILNETLDARCDLYSLGCILYELVTGLKPFSGSRVQVLHGHLERNPINPSDLVHGVPKALNDMIMSLLSKSTDQRIGYAETILQIIETLGVQRPHWPSTPSTGHSYLYRASFIENSKIQADIEDRLIQAKNGKGQVVIAFGESGLGKTRFASEIAKRVLKTGISVTTCECSFRGRHDTQPKPVTQPLYPFLHLLDHIADYCTEKGLEVYENILSEHAAILSEYSASIKSLTWVKHLPLAPKLEADQYLNRLFNALRSVLASYSQATPLLLILDDLQWADELSIAFLEFLTKEGLEGIAVLILGTMRTEEKTQQVSSMLKSNCVREVLLERMGIGDVEKLACGMLATEEIPQNFAEFLFEQSNGNPFFIAEYLRTAVAEHLLQRDRSGKWNFTHHTSSEAYCFKQLPLPNSLSELIKLRISRLTPEARKALDCAALLGRVFETELVSSVMQLHEENLGQIINELVERQVLEADEKDGFRFLHDKIREVTEHQLSSHQRRELHEKIARKLDNLRTNALKPETIDARLGHHWSCAGVPARAARHLRFAADFAHHQHANDEATRLNKAALSEIKKAEKTETGRQQYWNTEAISVNIALAQLYSLTRSYELARAQVVDALERQPSDVITKARLYRLSGKTFEAEHRHDDALSAYDEAERILYSKPNSSINWVNEHIEVKLGRLWTHYWAANSRLMDIEISETQVLVEDSGLPQHRYQFYLTQIFRNLRRDRYQVDQQTVLLGRQLLSAATSANLEIETSFAQFELGFLLLFAGELTEAKQVLEEALERSKQVGDTSSEVRSLCYYVILLRRMGNIAKTENAAHKLLRSAGKAQMMDYVGVAYASLGWVFFKKENLDFAKVKIKKAKEIWSSLSFDYSMKWTAVIVELKISFEERDVKRLNDCALSLLHHIQLKLPDKVELALEGITAAFSEKDHLEVLRHAKEALFQAEASNYL